MVNSFVPLAIAGFSARRYGYSSPGIVGVGLFGLLDGRCLCRGLGRDC